MIGKIIGNYRVIAEIDRGGMGIVYKGVHKNLPEQVVAIKMISPIFVEIDPKVKERFATEAASLARLSRHPNIVTLYDYIETKDGLFLIMEFIEGIKTEKGLERTLADRIRLRGALPIFEIIPLFREILSGVGFAHKNNVIHRDLKPANIMLTEFGTKVADFGIARIAAGETSILLSGQRIGTPAYMSPEQVLEKKLDKRTDIYSLGIVLFEVATGELPFKESDTSSILECHIKEKPPRPKEINPAVNEGLEKIILKALAKNPEDRFQTCDEFLSALEEIGKPREIGHRFLDETIEEETREANRVQEKTSLGKIPKRVSLLVWIIPILILIGIGILASIRIGLKRAGNKIPITKPPAAERLEKREAEIPKEVGYYKTPDYAFDVFVSETYAYVADRGSGLWIIEIKR